MKECKCGIFKEDCTYHKTVYPYTEGKFTWYSATCCGCSVNLGPLDQHVVVPVGMFTTSSVKVTV